jgi:hypothetical protein
MSLKRQMIIIIIINDYYQNDRRKDGSQLEILGVKLDED